MFVNMWYPASTQTGTSSKTEKRERNGERKQCAGMLPKHPPHKGQTTKSFPNTTSVWLPVLLEPQYASRKQSQGLCARSRLARYRLLVLCLPMRLKKSITFLELPELPLLPLPCSSYASAKRLLFCSTPFRCCWFESSPPMPAGYGFDGVLWLNCCDCVISASDSSLGWRYGRFP